MAMPQSTNTPSRMRWPTLPKSSERRDRPRAGEGRAEHLGADQDGGADDGDDVEPDDVAALGHDELLADGGNLYESGWRIKPIKPR